MLHCLIASRVKVEFRRAHAVPKRPGGSWRAKTYLRLPILNPATHANISPVAPVKGLDEKVEMLGGTRRRRGALGLARRLRVVLL